MFDEVSVKKYIVCSSYKQQTSRAADMQLAFWIMDSQYTMTMVVQPSAARCVRGLQRAEAVGPVWSCLASFELDSVLS
jgi:hypothetical protein